MISRPLLLLTLLAFSPAALAQSIATGWTGHAHDPQHTGISRARANGVGHILWQTPVDLAPQCTGNDLYIHYGTPLVSRSNTVILPVKTGAWGGFRVEGHAATTGSLVWSMNTDFVVAPHDWVPSCGVAISPRNRVYIPAAGGTLIYRDTADSAVASGTGRIAFYGLANFTGDVPTYTANVYVCTPLTCDRYGSVFFGFVVTGTNGAGLQSGIARVGYDGACAWTSASAASGSDSGISQVVMNCAPALSNDHKTLYIATSHATWSGGYLVAIDSRNLAPIARVRLKDVVNTGNDANLVDDGSGAPTVGPDGDVYYGVLEYPFLSNHDRGWMLHFNSALSQRKIPGAFGWDDTASIVPAGAVPGYTGTSTYLVLTKYNNYADPGIGGDGVNKLAVLDPNATETDPITGATVMKEVLTVAGVTPDYALRTNSTPNAVREWCVNTVAVDPAGKCALVNSEDGKAYRWDFTTNSLTQALTLTPGVGEAYTPSVIGPDGTAYLINNATLHAVGP